MGRPVKVTVIGAGSVQFSIGVVKDLCLTENLAGSHVTLMDIDEERLETIHKLAERYVKELGGSLTFDRTTDRRRALQDADFVINTAGKERMPREGRRALFEKYGRVAGNFHVGYMYNMALMLDIARDVEAVCPDAWLIQSGNPVREGVPLVTRETGVKIIGLCHGHYGYINVAKTLGLDPDKVSWTAPGLNHCIWLTDFRYEGEDAYPILDRWIENEAEAYWRDREANRDKYGLEDQMSRMVIDQYRKFGLLPIGDTTRGGGWWYKTDIDTRVFWYGPYGGFGSELHREPWHASLAKRLEEIHEVTSDPSRSVLEAFPPVKTREQQIPIIDALTNDVAGLFQINVPNQGALPGVPDHVVTELPVIIDKAGLHRIQLDPLPNKLMLEVIQPHILGIEWGVEAYVTGDAEMLVDALLMLNAYDHGGPTATSHAQARGFIEELLALPDEQDWAGQFSWRQPSWAHVLKRPAQ
ncbi:MAG TPA: alpha-glucosidase/alpha-galactosidase [Chloroflexi bacterium]|jgi:alpha-galactosidase|nr:alpha-glucosidase/alpha-galactosidase [Chloroflexota bacterium]